MSLLVFELSEVLSKVNYQNVHINYDFNPFIVIRNLHFKPKEIYYGTRWKKKP